MNLCCRARPIPDLSSGQVFFLVQTAQWLSTTQRFSATELGQGVSVAACQHLVQSQDGFGWSRCIPNHLPKDRTWQWKSVKDDSLIDDVPEENGDVAIVRFVHPRVMVWYPFLLVISLLIPIGHHRLIALPSTRGCPNPVVWNMIFPWGSTCTGGQNHAFYPFRNQPTISTEAR